MATLVGEGAADAAVAYYRERFADIGWAENTPYEGIHNALSELQQTGATLFVATSKPHVFAYRILEHFDLLDYFTDVYGSELDGTRADKRELLRYALDTTGISHRSTMIGDRSHDMLGAQSNDMTAVGVTYGYGTHAELQSSGAHHIVGSPDELCSVFSCEPLDTGKSSK